MTALAQALDDFNAGRWREAETACQAIVERHPDDAKALNLLGVLAHRAGQNEEAERWLRRAIGVDAENPEYHYNLGVALQVLGRLEEAITTYKHVLRLQPARAEAHNNLGYASLLQNRLEDAHLSFAEALRLRANYSEAQRNRGEAFRRQGLLFLQKGKLDEAQGRFELATRDNGEDAEAHNHLGVVHRQQKRLDEAVACFYRALALRPEYGSAHNNLGRVCEDRGRLEEAVARYRLALCYAPKDASIHNNLGNALLRLSRADEALICYQQASQIDGAEPVYFSNLANALTLAGRPEEAEVCCRRALSLRPSYVDALHNKAITLAAQGKFEEALTENEKALKLEPNHAGAHNCRALWWLQGGDFARGWPEYKWRWRVTGVKAREFGELAWDGTAPEGRTILLYCEQALGDTIQFIRYAPLVKALGATVIVECQRPLAQLLASCPGIDQLVPRGTPLPPFDMQAALLSLPGLLNTTLETIPAHVPYLHADPDLVAGWRCELANPGTFKVGIAWQGSATFAGDRMRSAKLNQFAPLARVPGVRLYGLQKGPGRDQIRAALRVFSLTDLGSTLDEGGGAFMDTAAVMMNLDLVITTDTSVAHLAGALGVPVWVALSLGPDWRWLRDREECPWYPSMRLFRQKRLHDWEEVFERVADELRQRAHASLSADTREPVTLRPARATVCILTYGDHVPYFRRCLDSVLRQTPPGRIELRLGFNDAPASLEYARRGLPTESAVESHTLPSGVRRSSYVSRDGLLVRLWDSPANLYKEPMSRIMYHDLPLGTDYVVWLDDDSFVEEGWWQALCPLLDRGVDYIGQEWWVKYLPGQEDMIRVQPWYRGVPFQRRAGKTGSWFMTGGFMVIRSQWLREVNFPDTEQDWKGDTLKQYGGDTLLGEIAHQLGWTRVVHDTHVKVNVDLEGKHPAPRRGGTGRQFGASVNVVVT
jgi:Flp pilus assembly protein TadD